MLQSILTWGETNRISPLIVGLQRINLSDGAWIDLLPAWVSPTGDLFDRLQHTTAWREESRTMFDRTMQVPRLCAFYPNIEGVDPVLNEMRDALRIHYARAIGGDFESTNLCLYRDGMDSVAWHGDRHGKGRFEDIAVAIVSLGAPRTFLLRPRGGGQSLRFELGDGDLAVMGGSCQRTWEHCVPKTRRAVGPRISIQFRPPGAR